MQPTVDDVRRFIAGMVESGNTDYGILADMVEEAGLCGELVYALRTARVFTPDNWSEMYIHRWTLISLLHGNWDKTMREFVICEESREIQSMGLLNEQGE